MPQACRCPRGIWTTPLTTRSNLASPESLGQWDQVTAVGPFPRKRSAPPRPLRPTPAPPSRSVPSRSAPRHRRAERTGRALQRHLLADPAQRPAPQRRGGAVGMGGGLRGWGGCGDGGGCGGCGVFAALASPGLSSSLSYKRGNKRPQARQREGARAAPAGGSGALPRLRPRRGWQRAPQQERQQRQGPAPAGGRGAGGSRRLDQRWVLASGAGGCGPKARPGGGQCRLRSRPASAVGPKAGLGHCV